MRAARPAIALDPRTFGRGKPFADSQGRRTDRPLGGDLRLFATTFAAGFLFVSVIIA